MNVDESPSAIAAELGDRLKQARLNRNKTQGEVAELAGVTRKTVCNAEKGQTQLETFVSIMSALDLLGHLDLFLPKQIVSPLQLAKMQGKKRKRASTTRPQKEEIPGW
ncbi:helix-turn-helix transcriptional regulator [Aeromonas veronii]|uniref:Helix-turn-helix transcriptional regulator n=1 Tax=Aeromonas veronii TaxID=654 RepID=A0A4S5CK13_AERVE|nr:helix-turn-helix transcriptional regulator [Aeromonas veronii]THJ44991.1 helix-turn-helix transcriptional regulator [Aeromonas veronii]